MSKFIVFERTNVHWLGVAVAFMAATPLFSNSRRRPVGVSSNGSACSMEPVSSFPGWPVSHSMVVACAPIGDRRRARVPAHRVVGRSFLGAAT